MSRAALAAALVALALVAACTPAPSPTFTVRSERARHPGPAPAIAGPFLRVLHLADFGDPTEQQGAVARGVGEAHRTRPFALALVPGDNVYPCGPDATAPGADACRFAADGNTLAGGFEPPEDPGFARHDGPLSPLAEPPAAEVYLSLGNHDVATWSDCRASDDPVAEGRLKACLELAHRSPVWRMPARHYAVERGAARFLIVDTNLVEQQYGGFALDDEVAFVRDQAPGCRPDACETEPGGCDKPWCFLVGHHPPVTAGLHRRDATPDYLARMDRLLAAGAGRIQAFLAGHDHDLQHLRSPAGLDVLVSGNGSRGRASERFEATSVAGTEVVFATVRWGYGVLEVARDGWRYRFEDDGGAPLYCCAATGAGGCAPSVCP
jgi:tartrate-resistant acid phosphatase type 5